MTRRELSGHEGPVTAVRFGDDERTVATASYDGRVRVWIDVDAPGSEPLVLDGHGGAPVRDVEFGPSGTLISTGGDGAALLWSLEFGDTSVPGLRARLDRSTTACLSVFERVRLLGQPEAAARVATSNCEAAHGRRLRD